MVPYCGQYDIFLCPSGVTVDHHIRSARCAHFYVVKCNKGVQRESALYALKI